MSKILITGNGFDLFHHLPTKYHHFISIMITIEEVEYDTDVSLEKLFGRVFKSRHQSDYDSIVENYNTAKIIFGHEKLIQIKELLKTNLWYKHFKNVLEIDTWIDFEMEIENILNQLSYFNKFDNKWEVNNNLFDDELINFYDFKTFNIIQKTNEIGGFKLNDKNINTRTGSIDIKKILEDLAKSFEDFIIIFNRYLVDIVSVFYPAIKQKSVIPFHLMNKIYTFNYTPTLENFYKVHKSKVVYLHGEINEDCDRQNIVLGISEMPKYVKASKMFDFTKYYQKVNKNSNNRFIEVPKKIKSSSRETIFYIIGHSLDESDKEYIIDLFKFLEFDYDKYSKICVFYFSEKDKENKWKNLFSIIDKNIIVEMNNTGRLYFSILTNETLTNEFKKELKVGG